MATEATDKDNHFQEECEEREERVAEARAPETTCTERTERKQHGGGPKQPTEGSQEQDCSASFGH